MTTFATRFDKTGTTLVDLLTSSVRFYDLTSGSDKGTPVAHTFKVILISSKLI